MHHRHIGITTGICLAAGLAGGVPTLTAQPQTADEHADLVKVRAISSVPAATPGEWVQVGVHFEIADGWHTYWPGQNDTGFGTTIDVKAPDGVEVEGPFWPAPHRYTAPGDILDHVHEGSVTPLFKVRVPEGSEIGSILSIDFDLAWLVCKELCIPGWETVTLTVPISDSSRPPTKEGKILSDARARVPETPARKIDLVGSTATISRPGATALAFYPDEASSRVENLLVAGYAEGDTLTLTLEGEDPVLSGVLEIWHGPDRTSSLQQITSEAVDASESSFE